MNTEQFDGHTPGPWYLNTPDPDPARTVRFISDVCTDLLGATDADARLIAAAPDLLAEVKRLRDLVDFAIAVIDSNHCYMGEEAQADLLKHLRGEDE